MGRGARRLMSVPAFPAALRMAHRLTLVALLPQALFLLLTLTDGQASWIAPAAAFAYVAFIFSFLGGLWWGVGLTIRPPSSRLFVVAVAPMLFCFALFIPWIWGWHWPGPQLCLLGIAISGSFVVDRRLAARAHFDPAWITVRTIASVVLGLLTLATGVATELSSLFSAGSAATPPNLH